jgi:hypothetical protein
MQNLNRIQWQLENKYDMILEKECSCTLFEMFSLKQFVLLFDSYSNGRIQPWTIKGRRSQAHLKWAWNGNGPKLLAPITPNKNGWPFYKNLDTMIKATSPHYPKYVVQRITSIETILIPLLEMGSLQTLQKTSKP